MKLHTAALVAGTLWLGSLLAVTAEPHQSVAHLAAYVSSRAMQRKWCSMIRFLGARWVLSPHYEAKK